MRCKALMNVLFYCQKWPCAESSWPISSKKAVRTRVKYTDLFYIRSDRIYMEDGCCSGLLRIRHPLLPSIYYLMGPTGLEPVTLCL